MNTSSLYKRIRHQVGATLMEVLASLAIFSTGIVALTNNINGSMQDLNIAGFHASAVLAADDLVDRIRNNPGGTYNRTSTIEDLKNPAALVSCIGSCTSNQIAGIDLQRWADTYADVLTHADVKIERSGERVTIAFAVEEDKGGNLSLNDCFSGTEKDPYCFVVQEPICEISTLTSFCS